MLRSWYVFPALSVLPLALAACSSSHVAAEKAASLKEPGGPALAADAGLELTTFACGLDERRLAIELSSYADQPLPISHELEDLWDAHGLRMVSLPLEEADTIVARLRTSGGSQRQWLGQAYAWTEAARGSEFGDNRTIALDAERIRLSAGALRLLLRSWVEPVPPEPRVGMVSGARPAGSDLPGAVLRVELVPQHREARPDDARRNPLTVTEPSIDAEGQGLLFSRLYARMSVPSGRALLILPERPGTNWRRLAQQPDPTPAPPPATDPKAARESSPENPWPKRSGAAAPPSNPAASDEWSKVRAKSEDAPKPASPTPSTSPKPQPPTASGAPRLGEVVRGPIVPRAAASTESEGTASTDPLAPGPAPARVPTLGEAMLATVAIDESGGDPRRGKSRQSTLRTMILLVPHVPREFHLLGPASPTAAPREVRQSPE